jgi:hypothetical protein
MPAKLFVELKGHKVSIGIVDQRDAARGRRPGPLTTEERRKEPNGEEDQNWTRLRLLAPADGGRSERADVRSQTPERRSCVRDLNLPLTRPQRAARAV